MKKRGVIFYLVLVIFILLTLPSISAYESDTLLHLKKTFSNKTLDLIKEKIINSKLLLKSNHSILVVIIVLLFDLIAYRLIYQNYTEIALLILLINLIIIGKFIE